MKRKFLSIAICLMFCLTSVLMLGGCGKDKPIVVAQHEAEAALNSAMETLQQAESIKLTMEMPMGVGSLVVIGTKDKSYIEMSMAYTDEDGSYSMEINAWTKEENDAYATYVNMVGTENGESEESSIKTISLIEETIFENEYTEDSFEGLNFNNFVEATKLNGEMSIVFRDEDGSRLTAKIVEGKLVSITIMQGTMPMTMYIHYGNFVNDIPELAEKDWVLASKIEIPDLKQEFVLNEELSLIGLNLEFYGSNTNYLPDETFVITEEMLEKISIEGFDSKTLTNGTPRTMTISYLGLEFTLEYEVVEAQEQE